MKIFVSTSLVIAFAFSSCNSQNTHVASIKSEARYVVDDSIKPKQMQPVSRQKKSYLTFVVNGVAFKMAKVKAGTFLMGCVNSQDSYGSEPPAHQVTLHKNYYIGTTEVTQALWKAVMKHNPSTFKGKNRPVEYISWDECQLFLAKLNALSGQHFRLPTEVEWEFAARGGNNSCRYEYSGSDSISEVAWYDENSHGKTHEVEKKKPNELGLYDMSGNVWEWCSDRTDDPVIGSNCVYRGGGWGYGEWTCTPSYYHIYPSDQHSYYLGLRLALSKE